ncbi:MAG: ABC transporter permease [Sedimentisphaerales bacterium]|nr:ABC transporter permease [Sedimentisphaerales bacterium]
MLSFVLSWRYFIRKRVALAAVSAIMVIVMMVVIVLNVMSGLVNEVRGKNQQWSGDIILSRSSLVGFDHYEEFMGKASMSESVAGVTAVIRSFGITSDNMPVQVYGVDASSFTQVCMPGKLEGGGEFALPDNSCYVGTYFGSSYRTKLNITFPGINYRGLPAGPEAGQNQNFEILDTFRIGMPDIDNGVYVNFGQLQQLSWMAGQDNRPARCHELRIKLKDNIDSEQAITEIKDLWQSFVASKESEGLGSLLKDVQVQSWYQFRRGVIAPLENEKNMMSLVFALIAIVCSFIIFAIFYMIVIDKQKDIGIIRSCGGRRYQLAGLYLNFGLLVGLTGTIIGLILGVSFVTHTNQIQDWLYVRTGFMLWPPDLYAIDKIPDVVLVGETTVICVAAIVFSVLGALAPALLAAWRKPVDSLRVE